MTVDDELDLILAGEDEFFAGGYSAMTELMEADSVEGQTGDSAGVIVGGGYVLVRANRFGQLRTNDDVKLNGKKYRVAQKMRIQDGKVLQVYLGDPDV